MTKTVWWGDGRVKETVDGHGYKTQVSYDLTNKKITTGNPKGDIPDLPHS